MSALPISHRLVVVGLALSAIPLASGCASTGPTPTPTHSSSPAAPTSAAAKDSCADLYAVGTHLTDVRSCTVNGELVSVGTYGCVGPERVGSLDSSAGLSQTVWFVVPGVVTAVSGSLTTDPAYVAAFEKCTGKAP